MNAEPCEPMGPRVVAHSHDNHDSLFNSDVTAAEKPPRWQCFAPRQHAPTTFGPRARAPSAFYHRMPRGFLIGASA